MSKSPSENGDRAQEPSTNDAKSDVLGGESWPDVFDRTEPGLRKFLAGKLPQTADVDDCMQSLSVAMLTNETKIPAAARKAWLYRVAANEAANWWRKKSTTDRILEKHAAYSLDAADNAVISGPTEIETKETIQQIKQAIENLSDDARRVIKMRLRDGMTFQSIADQLHLPLGTVLTRMRRAMLRLRSQLGDDTDGSKSSNH